LDSKNKKSLRRKQNEILSRPNKKTKVSILGDNHSKKEICVMTDKKATEILREEHENVLKKLDALEKVISNLDKKAEISAELKELASFFKTDFWVHFAKEEEALFPEIENFIPREGGPTGVMLIDHEDLRATNEQIQGAVDEYLREIDNSKAREMIREHGSHFIGLLREHINKEDSILFRMADMHLDGTQLDKIIKLFAEIEKRYKRAQP
jgi:hemerythrin-like domain-containing protein